MLLRFLFIFFDITNYQKNIITSKKLKPSIKNTKNIFNTKAKSERFTLYSKHLLSH